MYNYNLTDVPIVDEFITTSTEDCCNKEIILSSLNVKHILGQLSQINQKLGNIERLLLVSYSKQQQQKGGL